MGAAHLSGRRLGSRDLPPSVRVNEGHLAFSLRMAGGRGAASGWKAVSFLRLFQIDSRGVLRPTRAGRFHAVALARSVRASRERGEDEPFLVELPAWNCFVSYTLCTEQIA